MLSRTTIQRLTFFLSFDAKYNSPTIINSEIARAEKMGLLKVENGIVSFTDEAIELIDEYNIVDGVNEKFWKAIELEKKGMAKLADTLKNQVSVEGFWWFPEEWKGVKFVMKQSEPVKQTTSIIPKTKMVRPRKV